MAQLGNLIVTGSSRFLNKVYFSDEGVFSGDLNLANGNLILAGKTAIRGGIDPWLRINDTNAFSNGIYCGSNTLRTDGEFQVGSTGNYFKANSSAITCGKVLNANEGLNVSGVTTLNNGVVVKNIGVELYHITPFIDFHYNNSTANYTSRIIESSSGQININGVNFSNSTVSATSVTSTNHTATNSTINILTVSSRLAADAANAVFNNVYVKDELRSTTWAIDNITNLGSTFYVAPCIIFTNPTVYINSKSGTTVTLTITDNAIISSTIGGQTWTSGSKIKLMGRINTSVLGVVNGTMARQLNTTTTKTAYITLNFVTADDCAGIVQGQTYSGANVSDLKLMMYEVNLSVNGGTAKNRPVGIRMSSYNEDKKSSIDIYNGTVDDGKPVARMGALDGLPQVNGTTPTGYGFYAAGNAYFSGTLVSSSGTIGGFTLSKDSIQNGSLGTANSVIMCIGSNGSANIGGSGSINGWCFTASNTFGVTKAGALYSTSGKIGKYTITDKWLITGSGSSCTGIGGNQAFWAGSESSDNAPFRVSYGGSIYSVSGTIGSFTLDSTYLQSSDKTVGLSATASDWAFWAGGSSSSTAKFRVNHAGQLWATSATISGNVTATSGTIGGCSISNGKLIVPSANITGKLNASQIQIGDYTNYSDLTVDSYARYGFTLVADGNNNPWFQHTPQRDISINPVGYNTYKCVGGETFKIEFEFSSTVQATTTSGSNTYVNINVGLYGKTKDGTDCWYIPQGKQSDSGGSTQTVSTQVTLGTDVRSFSVFIQCNGTGTFSGTLKIRNISVRRMTDAKLIVNGNVTVDKIASNAVTSAKIAAGAITADKITTDNITSTDRKNWINLRNGQFSYNSGVLSWNGSVMKIGGWNVTSDCIYVNNKTGISSNTGRYAFWAGESNSSNGSSKSDAKFKVGHNGELIASNANITGKITTSSGTIGKFNITSTYLSTGTGSTCAGMGGDQAFWAGNSTSNSAPFRVSYGGKFVSTDADITGSINATTIKAKKYYQIYNDNQKNTQNILFYDNNNLYFGVMEDHTNPNYDEDCFITFIKGDTLSLNQISFNGTGDIPNIVTDTISNGMGITIQVNDKDFIFNSDGNITIPNSVYATAIYTNNKETSIGKNIKTTGTLHVDGAAGFNGSVTVRSTFGFRDYEEEEKNSTTYRRPVASASADVNKVAWLQSGTGNKINIRARFGSSTWSTATFTGSSSDIRLKKNIYETNVKALPIVMQMKMHEFDWRDDNSHQPLGCIADELEKLDPMLTSGGGYEKDGSMNVKCINTLLLTEYNSKAIQELYTLVQKQESKIKYLENQLKDKKR